jgi:hypothetical protein
MVKVVSALDDHRAMQTPLAHLSGIDDLPAEGETPGFRSKRAGEIFESGRTATDNSSGNRCSGSRNGRSTPVAAAVALLGTEAPNSLELT